MEKLELLNCQSDLFYSVSLKNKNTSNIYWAHFQSDGHFAEHSTFWPRSTDSQTCVAPPVISSNFFHSHSQPRCLAYILFTLESLSKSSIVPVACGRLATTVNSFCRNYGAASEIDEKQRSQICVAFRRRRETTELPVEWKLHSTFSRRKTLRPVECA